MAAMAAGLLAACGGSGGDSPTGPTQLVVEDITIGTGATAAVGDTVTVHYVGTLLNGTQFDSSYPSGRPFTFRIGAGQVIPGWDEAFPLMRKGDKRTLIVPYWLAYGVNGRPPKIPPRATLVFDVEVLDIR